MSPPHCEIKFDKNPQGIYYSGQTLSGSVVFKLNKPKRVNDLKLVINGCAEVKWTTRKGKKDKKRTITYRGEEQPFHSEKSLVPRNSDDAIEIPAGTHIYNFACELPSSLATSFEGEYGFIRYTVSAILDRPWKFNQTYKVAFTVLKPLDLNLELPLQYPVKREKTKTFCCWPCKSQPLNITVEIPASGFVPGQKIPITTTLDNASDVNIHRIKCQLQRIVSFTSQPPRVKTKTVTKILASVFGEITDETSEQCTVHLEIPSVPPTGKCSVLGIKYELLVEIRVGLFHHNPELKIPITIGTIPFHQPAPVSEMSMSVQPDNQEGFEETFKVPSAPSPEGGPTAPPPSYEEAVHGVTVQVNDDPNAIGTHEYARGIQFTKWDGISKLLQYLINV